MSALICGSFAYDTIMGEATRFGDALNRIAGVAERPAARGRAGTTMHKQFGELK